MTRNLIKIPRSPTPARADLNLTVRKTNWYGDPTLSHGMPCISPQMRNVLNDRLLDDLLTSMKGCGKATGRNDQARS